MTERDEETVRLTAYVSGRVQGVGFRYWAREQARVIGLVGAARNLDDGRVAVVAEGPRTACVRLLAALRGSDAPGRVTSVADEWSTPRGVTGFVVG
jgi:acylphosphatase